MRLSPATLLLPVLLFVVTETPAAPPPGHPSAEQAIGILGVQGDEKLPVTALPNAGVVQSAQDSNAFSYIEVKPDGSTATRWIAAPRVSLSPGDRIRFDEGRMMQNFYSRKLKITFESITFVSRAVREAPEKP